MRQAVRHAARDSTCPKEPLCFVGVLVLHDAFTKRMLGDAVNLTRQMSSCGACEPCCERSMASCPPKCRFAQHMSDVVKCMCLSRPCQHHQCLAVSRYQCRTVASHQVPRLRVPSTYDPACRVHCVLDGCTCHDRRMAGNFQRLGIGAADTVPPAKTPCVSVQICAS